MRLVVIVSIEQKIRREIRVPINGLISWDAGIRTIPKRAASFRAKRP